MKCVWTLWQHFEVFFCKMIGPQEIVLSKSSKKKQQKFVLRQPCSVRSLFNHPKVHEIWSLLILQPFINITKWIYEKAPTCPEMESSFLFEFHVWWCKQFTNEQTGLKQRGGQYCCKGFHVRDKSMLFPASQQVPNQVSSCRLNILCCLAYWVHSSSYYFMHPESGPECPSWKLLCFFIFHVVSHCIHVCFNYS